MAGKVTPDNDVAYAKGGQIAALLAGDLQKRLSEQEITLNIAESAIALLGQEYVSGDTVTAYAKDGQIAFIKGESVPEESGSSEDSEKLEKPENTEDSEKPESAGGAENTDEDAGENK